tara:strand:- start:1585 stop:1827 length:243 start_codon:yes stop_codon:yes gene_type:complete
MSTTIAEITGRMEKYDHKTQNPGYVNTYMYINRFYGGKENGRMLQLTTGVNSYIQLTQDQVKDLAKVLTNAFNDEIYPSE